jgi:hypothetical protein
MDLRTTCTLYCGVAAKAAVLENEIAGLLHECGHTLLESTRFPSRFPMDSVPLQTLVDREAVCRKAFETCDYPYSVCELTVMYTTINMVKRDAEFSMKRCTKNVSFMSRTLSA